MKRVFNKRSGAVVMSPVSERLDAAVEIGVGSNLTQASGSSYFSLYTFFLKFLHEKWSWARILILCLISSRNGKFTAKSRSSLFS